jgi:hypothetical protein
MKQARSLKPGTIMFAKFIPEINLDYIETVVAIVLSNDKINRVCRLHIFNFKKGVCIKEWDNTYSYANMIHVIKQCHMII